MNFPFPTMGEDRNQGEKSHDSGGSTEPGRGRTKDKGRINSFPGSLDQMGPTQKNDHLGRIMDTGVVWHLFPSTLSTPANLHK